MIGGGVLLLSDPLQNGWLASLSIVITELSERGLRGLGLDVARSARTLFMPDRGFGMQVDNDCNGAWAHLVFLAAVLAFPAPWRAKVVGLVLGEAALFLLNVLRVMSLFLIGVHAPELFRAAHVYVWQFLIVGLALALFLVWIERVARRPT